MKCKHYNVVIRTVGSEGFQVVCKCGRHWAVQPSEEEAKQEYNDYVLGLGVDEPSIYDYNLNIDTNLKKETLG